MALMQGEQEGEKIQTQKEFTWLLQGEQEGEKIQTQKEFTTKSRVLHDTCDYSFAPAD